MQGVRRAVHGAEGASARRVRQELWGRVRQKLWGDSFWSDGYFYRSIGSTTTEAVQFYIEHSQRKHWMGLDYEQHEDERAEEQKKQVRLTDFA